MSKKIVVLPTDLSEESLAALPVACQVLGNSNVIVHLLHVISFLAPVGLSHGHIPIDWIGETERALHRLLPSLEIQPTVTVLRVGHPATEIVRYAEAVGADAIAMVRNRRQGVEHFLLGSTGEEVVRTSPLPVLICHPPEEQPVETTLPQELELAR